MPEPKDGEGWLQARYISLDAANRAWMHGATYRARVEANTVMAGGGIAEVVASKAQGSRRAISCSATPAGRIMPRCRPSISPRCRGWSR
jgi:NADPH-dependent curcumin reductase CurA